MPKAFSVSLSLSLSRARGQRSRYYAVRRRDLTWAASHFTAGRITFWRPSRELIANNRERSAGRVIELLGARTMSATRSQHRERSGAESNERVILDVIEPLKARGKPLESGSNARIGMRGNSVGTCRDRSTREMLRATAALRAATPRMTFAANEKSFFREFAYTRKPSMTTYRCARHSRASIYSRRRSRVPNFNDTNAR